MIAARLARTSPTSRARPASVRAGGSGRADVVRFGAQAGGIPGQVEPAVAVVLDVAERADADDGARDVEVAPGLGRTAKAGSGSTTAAPASRPAVRSIASRPSQRALTTRSKRSSRPPASADPPGAVGRGERGRGGDGHAGAEGEARLGGDGVGRGGRRPIGCRPSARASRSRRRSWPGRRASASSSASRRRSPAAETSAR